MWASAPAGLSYHRSVGDSGGTKHSAVALDLCRSAQRLGVVVGKFYRRPAFDSGYFADQADRVETCAGIGIAPAKIVGEQCPPARAEADAAFLGPLGGIVKIGGVLKIGSSDPRRNRSAKICVQPKNLVDVQRVRGNQQ